MSLGVRITVEGVSGALAQLGKLERVERAELANDLARLGATQTQRRISSEKTSPQGAAWKQNREGGSILFKSGSHLYDSIDHKATSVEAMWGAGWIGARVHQFGAVIRPVKAKRLAFSIGGKAVFAMQSTIPARPYLGVSAANAKEMEEVAQKALERLLQ